ncbi:MAG: hypothetical protein ACFFG0_03320 [Candidatus Thorarchaeota archaeon]
MVKKSVIKSSRITPEQDRKLEILQVDFAKLVDESVEGLIRKKFDGEIDLKIKELEKQIKELKKLKKELDPTPKTAEEINYLNETREIIKNKPEYLKARIRKYANDFGKILLSEEEFKKLVKKSRWK